MNAPKVRMCSITVFDRRLRVATKPTLDHAINWIMAVFLVALDTKTVATLYDEPRSPLALPVPEQVRSVCAHQ